MGSYITFSLIKINCAIKNYLQIYYRTSIHRGKRLKKQESLNLKFLILQQPEWKVVKLKIAKATFMKTINHKENGKNVQLYQEF